MRQQQQQQQQQQLQQQQLQHQPQPQLQQQQLLLAMQQQGFAAGQGSGFEQNLRPATKDVATSETSYDRSHVEGMFGSKKAFHIHELHPEAYRRHLAELLPTSTFKPKV